MTRGAHVLLFSVAVAVCFHISAATACTPGRPGISARFSYPRSGAVDVPKNARIVVSYDWVPSFLDPPSAFGTGVGIRKAGGAEMAASVSETSASYDWTNRTHVVIKPQAELAPNTTYELFDHHPAVPCYPDSGAQCEAATVTTFATFTTGSLPDTTPPQFDGLESVSPQASHTVCENSACCGPYIIHRLLLQWKLGSDDRTGEEVSYNVYRDGQLFISLLRDVSLNGVQVCSNGGPFGPLLPAGVYTVRAVDWAGNEDGNGRVHTVPSLCSVIASPSDGGTDASSGFDVMPTNDGSGAQHGEGDAPPVDGSAVASPASDGCGCRVGRARSNLCGLPLVVMAILVSVFRRRPARSSRE